MNESERNYLISKLKQECKVHYFKNQLSGKNPMHMNDIELMCFIDEYKLDLLYTNVLNDCTLKFLTITNKFKEAKIPKDVLDILERLLVVSPNSYLVGGATRDIILGECVKDYDFVSDISYERLKEVFSECKFKETGTEYLVFNLNYNGEDYEIAMFRKDSNKSDGRRPDSVEIGTIYEDALRRDFTTGNIFWNPNELFILEQSVDDILERKLRFVGSPEQRLKEDTLRGIRFYRILKTKNLIPDAESLKAVRRNWKDIISSNEHRIMLEIEKICLS